MLKYIFKAENYKYFLSLFSVSSAIIIYYILNLFWTAYLTCPNRDFLSWDGDLRFISALGLLDSFRNLNFGDFVFKILDTPTWPVLRNLIQAAVLGIWGLNTDYDSLITVVQFGLMIFCVLLILWKDFHFAGLLFSVLLFFSLLSASDFIIYIFSPMLEIQGALFFLLSVHFSYICVRRKSPSHSELLKAGISIFLLLQTKYPYGYMFLFCLFLFLFFSETSYSAFFFIRYLLYSLYRKSGLFSFSAVLLILFLLSKGHISSRLSKNIFYVLLISGTADFVLYIIREKASLFNLGYEKIINIFKYLFLPSVLWVISHPDRLGSSAGTISHVQMEGYGVGEAVEKNLDYYLYFFKTVFFSFWDRPYSIIISGTFLFALTLFLFLAFRKGFRHVSRFQYFFFFLFAGILGLSVLTPNHQKRHILHLLPLWPFIALYGFRDACFIIIKYISALITRTEELKFFSYILQSNARKYSVLLFQTVCLGTALFFMHDQMTKIPLRLQNVNLCFSGKQNIYETPRELKTLAADLVRENTVFLSTVEDWHYNKPDTELVIRILTFKNRVKLSFRAEDFQKKKNAFSQILIGGKNCDVSAESLQKLAGTELVLTQKKSGKFSCAAVYKRKSQ
ncbi:MAG TPA: hypothetical protein PK453_08355 [Leptospiraceae bacterium]|nr:hypothetical protein [Leptospiraceae bacterium]HNF24501.1 hypothetical protein [Leptospiraceae bacterium]HNI96153.1 hypothetical protein [Leptospiraceae bacterium]HNM04456.1 hypothetical protein [Leptospiraceae bacterium]HNN04189.1 hypothetical protein [Leptospiraceae bacterium]